MSAPRKIWAAPSTARGWNVAFCSDDTPEDARDRCEVYHHDDVVRELVEIARDVDHWMRGERGYEGVGYGTKLRAALAKIAQEG